MDVSKVEEKITEHTRAIMPVHIYGHPVDMDPLRELADRHGLFILEDAAEAHGAEYLSNRGEDTSRWLRCGGVGDLSCFSFYANKLITTGEGGMVLTNEPVLAEKARSHRNLCFRQEKRFYHTELGNNFRLTNLQAALGLAQLERIDAIVEKKRWIGKEYTERLKNIPGLQLPVEESWARQVYWMYGMVLDKSVRMDATEVADKLRAKGVETRPFFLGMHEQPALQRMGLFRSEKYPVAERLSRQGLYLPSGLTLTEPQLKRVTEAVKEVLR
jgi:perosamine synthetase